MTEGQCYVSLVSDPKVPNTFAMENKTFFYFAYGSNLLTERIRINNPSARAKGIGELKNYKLDFNNKSKVS